MQKTKKGERIGNERSSFTLLILHNFKEPLLLVAKVRIYFVENV